MNMSKKLEAVPKSSLATSDDDDVEEEAKKKTMMDLALEMMMKLAPARSLFSQLETLLLARLRALAIEETFWRTPTVLPLCRPSQGFPVTWQAGSLSSYLSSRVLCMNGGPSWRAFPRFPRPIFAGPPFFPFQF